MPHASLCAPTVQDNLEISRAPPSFETSELPGQEKITASPCATSITAIQKTSHASSLDTEHNQQVSAASSLDTILELATPKFSPSFLDASLEQVSAVSYSLHYLFGTLIKINK